MGRPPTLRPQLRRDSFYERDCQGQTSSSLIPRRLFPRQSAPTAEGTRPCGASGYAEQSASASVHLESAPDPTGRMQALGSRDATRTMVLSETRHTAGLTLLPVLRGGLELDEYLGVTAGRANESLETAPRTVVPDPGAAASERHPHRRLVEPGASALASSVASDRSALLSSTAAASAPRACG
jgi:hypothetical protein